MSFLYRVATAIRHFMTDSWCICLIHLCKVVFLNSPPPLLRITLTIADRFATARAHCSMVRCLQKISICYFTKTESGDGSQKGKVSSTRVLATALDNRVVQKTAQSLMHRHLATVCSRIKMLGN